MLPTDANLQLTAAVYSDIMLIVNDIFVKLMIMKIKYILCTLLVEYSIFRIYLTFLLIKCIIVAEILS